MSDETPARGGGARRCCRHNNGSRDSRSRLRSTSVTRLSPNRRSGQGGSRRRRRVRRVTSSAPAARDGGDRSVHQALCGGIVAGVLFGGVLGGIIAGAAAVSAATLVAKRNRRRQAAAAASASASSPTSASSASYPAALSDNASWATMTTEEAMIATGRAIASAEPDFSTRGESGGTPERGEGGSEGGAASSGEKLPAAHLVASPVHHAVAIPCTSRSMRTARTLSAVTATPDNGVVVGVPMSGVPRRVVAADRVVAACPNGGDVGGGVVQDVRGELHEGETEREGEEDEDEWWAGEEFEEEWACIFEAFCPEGEERRLPCLAAREPLQGSGVTARVARGILRIADWNESGDLGPDEFALAMYLCRRYRLGEGVPSVLEAWMIPPALREARGCEGNSGLSPAFPPRR